MKNILFVIIIIWFVSSCSGGKRILSSWHDFSDDQISNSRFTYNYDEDTKLLYRISNDKDWLYLDIIADHFDVKRALLFSGLNIWIDSTAKGKKLQGLQLLASKFPHQNGHQPLEGRRPLKEELEDFRMGSDLNESMSLETIGLPFGSIDYEIYTDSLNGLHFSFKIPIKNIVKKNQNPPIISLSIESTEIPGKPMHGGRSGGGQLMISGDQGMRGNNQGMMPGRQGMQGGGQGPGGQMPPQPPNDSRRGLSIKIKKLQLAINGNAE